MVFQLCTLDSLILRTLWQLLKKKMKKNKNNPHLCRGISILVWWRIQLFHRIWWWKFRRVLRVFSCSNTCKHPTGRCILVYFHTCMHEVHTLCPSTSISSPGVSEVRYIHTGEKKRYSDRYLNKSYLSSDAMAVQSILGQVRLKTISWPLFCQYNHLVWVYVFF